MKSRKVFLLLLVPLLALLAALLFLKPFKGGTASRKGGNVEPPFTFRKVLKGKTVFQVKGARVKPGEAGRIEIEGNVVFSLEKKGEALRLQCDKLSATADFKWILFQGNVVVVGKGMTIKTERIDYEDGRSLSSQKPTTVQGRLFGFHATFFSYDLTTGDLAFGGISQAKITLRGRSYDVQASHMVLNNAKRLLQIWGSPLTFRSDREEYRMPQMTLFFDGDQNWTNGEVLQPEGFLERDGFRRELNCARLEMTFQKGKLEGARCFEGAWLKEVKGERSRVFQAAEMLFRFSSQGQAEKLSVPVPFGMETYLGEKKIGQGGAASLEASLGEGGEIKRALFDGKGERVVLIEGSRRVWGHKVTVEGAKEETTLEGDGGVLEEGNQFVRGESLFLAPRRDYLTARTNVQGRVEKSGLSYVCRFLKKEKNNLRLEGGAFLRGPQGEIFGNSVLMDLKTEALTVDKGWVSKENLRFEGERLEKRGGVLKSKNKTVVTTKELTLRGGAGEVVEKDGKSESFNLVGGVLFSTPQGKGNADRARALLAKNLLYLEGHVLYQQKGKGDLTGEKLTLNLKDGTMVAQSEREQSTEVVIERKR